MLTVQTMAIMDDGHLIASLNAAIDPITSTPVELELLKRFENAVGNADITAAAEENELSADDINKLGEAIDNVEVTVALLDALAEAEIKTVEDWTQQRALLDALTDAEIEDVDALTEALSHPTEEELTVLETAVQENTAALHELIALLKSGHVAAPAIATAPAADAKGTRTRKPAGDAPPAAATAPAEAAKPIAVTYEQAAKAVTALIQRKGKPAALDVLKKFGATKLPEVQPAKFAEVVATCEAEV